MTYRKTMLSASIITALMFTGVAMAHTSQPNKHQQPAQPQNTTQQSNSQTDQSTADQKNAQNLKGIVVVGIRGSLQKSLEIKRDANAIVSAVNAEDLGKFPNTDVAEAMTQMPGVTIDRNMGQGDLVSIDGTDPALNETFLNGHLLAQVPWLIGSNPSRGFDFTILPPEIVGNIEVYKTSEARLPEGSIGGTIIVHERNPLDLPANHIVGDVGATYNENAAQAKPIGAVMYSWKNQQQTFGVLVSLSHYDEQVNRRGIEIFSYNPASTFKNATGPKEGLVPSEINSAYFQQNRKRNGATIELQYRPNNQLEFKLNGLYLHESYSNFNQSVYPIVAFQPDSVTSLGSASNGIIGSGTTCSTLEDPSCPGVSNSIYDSNPRDSTVTIKSLDLHGKFTGDNWGVSAQVGGSQSKDPRSSMYSVEANYLGGFSFDINKGVTFADNTAARDPNNWFVASQGAAGSGYQYNDQQATLAYAQVDFHNDFDSAFNELQYGIRWNRNNSLERNHTFSPAVTGVGAGTIGSLGLFGGYVNVNTNFPGFSTDQGRHIQISKAAEIAYINGLGLVETPSGLEGDYNITEKTMAGYVQQDFASGNLSGNVGVRYIHTKTNSGAYQFSGAPVLPAPADAWKTANSAYNMFLPSFNIAYSLSNDVVLRAAGSKVMARAPINQEASSLFLNDNTTPPNGTAGNVNLKPYKSYNFNASLEWYFAPQSMLSISGFFKHITNYVVTQSAFRREFNQLSKTSPGAYQILVNDGYCEVGTGFCQYSISAPTNGGSGRIRGFSVAYQQAYSNGFGIVASGTYALGTSASGGPLPYNSKYSVNFSPYYEKGPFSARLTYGWRSKYYAGGYVAGAASSFVHGYNELDFSVGYAFNKHYSISLDALNILNERYFQYYGVPSEPANRYYNGRRYLAKFRFSF